jgi:hypothetical protein
MKKEKIDFQENRQKSLENDLNSEIQKRQVFEQENLKLKM